MAYDPILEDLIHRGITGDTPVWPRIRDNHNTTWEEYEPQVHSAGGGGTSLQLVSASTAAGSLSTSYATYLRWVCPRNLDDVPVSVTVLWVASAAATMRVTSGVNSATATITPGGAGIVASTVSVVPAAAAGAAPLLAREMILEVKADTGGVTTITVLNVIAHYASGALPSGEQSSGWARMAALADDADEPLTSERIHRTTAGPALLANDRPACLASMGQDVVAASGSGDYGTTGTEWESVYRWQLPNAAASDKYGLAVYVEGSATSWEAVVVMDGGELVEMSGSADGWQFASVSGSPSSVGGTVRLRWTGASGGAYVTIQALQLFRLDPGN